MWTLSQRAESDMNNSEGSPSRFVDPSKTLNLPSTRSTSWVSVHSAFELKASAYRVKVTLALPCTGTPVASTSTLEYLMTRGNAVLGTPNFKLLLLVSPLAVEPVTVLSVARAAVPSSGRTAPSVLARACWAANGCREKERNRKSNAHTTMRTSFMAIVLGSGSRVFLLLNVNCTILVAVVFV